MQTRSMDNGSATEPRRLSTVPPSDLWPLGRYDTALFVNDSANHAVSPGIGLNGKLFSQDLPLTRSNVFQDILLRRSD